MGIIEKILEHRCTQTKKGIYNYAYRLSDQEVVDLFEAMEIRTFSAEGLKRGNIFIENFKKTGDRVFLKLALSDQPKIFGVVLTLDKPVYERIC